MLPDAIRPNAMLPDVIPHDTMLPDAMLSDAMLPDAATLLDAASLLDAPLYVVVSRSVEEIQKVQRNFSTWSLNNSSDLKTHIKPLPT